MVNLRKDFLKVVCKASVGAELVHTVVLTIVEVLEILITIVGPEAEDSLEVGHQHQHKNHSKEVI